MNDRNNHLPPDSDDTLGVPNRPRPLNVPRPKIPNYRFIKPIGDGAFGTVWLGEETVAGVFRAVKVLHRAPGEDMARIERGIEAIHKYQTLAEEHPHLVRIVTSGLCSVPGSETADRQTAYYVMEIADHAGGPQPHRPTDYAPLTLKTILRRYGRLPIGNSSASTNGEEPRTSRSNDPPFGVLECATRLLDAIDHLHKSGMHHRDVKPDNVVLVGGVLKLADIDLAAPDNDEGVGTPGYVLTDGKPDDLFAIGKIVYEMTTGLPAAKFPEWPGDLDPTGDPKSGVPAEPRLKPLRQLINDLCHPSSDRRQSDVREIRRRLGNLSSSGEPGFRTTRRRAVLALCATPLVGAVAGGWGMAWWNDRSDFRKRTRGRSPFNGSETLQIVQIDGREFRLLRQHKPNQLIPLPQNQTRVVFYDVQTAMRMDPGADGKPEMHLVVAGILEIFNLDKLNGNPGSGDIQIADGEIDQVYLIAGDAGDENAIMVLLYHGEPGAEPGVLGRFRRKIRLSEIQSSFPRETQIPIYLAYRMRPTPQIAEAIYRSGADDQRSKGYTIAEVNWTQVTTAASRDNAPVANR